MLRCNWLRTTLRKVDRSIVFCNLLCNGIFLCVAGLCKLQRGSSRRANSSATCFGINVIALQFAEVIIASCKGPFTRAKFTAILGVVFFGDFDCEKNSDV